MKRFPALLVAILALVLCAGALVPNVSAQSLGDAGGDNGTLVFGRVPFILSAQTTTPAYAVQAFDPGAGVLVPATCSTPLSTGYNLVTCTAIGPSGFDQVEFPALVFGRNPITNALAATIAVATAAANAGHDNVACGALVAFGRELQVPAVQRALALQDSNAVTTLSAAATNWSTALKCPPVTLPPRGEGEGEGARTRPAGR